MSDKANPGICWWLVVVLLVTLLSAAAAIALVFWPEKEASRFGIPPPLEQPSSPK